MKKFILVVALFATGVTVSFAQNAPTQAAKTEKPAAKKGKKSSKPAAQTAMYQCPMKCEPASAKAGKCGKCGMDLVEVKKKAK
jgi:transcription initiation factor IIE alpha subunit